MPTDCSLDNSNSVSLPSVNKQNLIVSADLPCCVKSSSSLPALLDEITLYFDKFTFDSIDTFHSSASREIALIDPVDKVDAHSLKCLSLQTSRTNSLMKNNSLPIITAVTNQRDNECYQSSSLYNTSNVSANQYLRQNPTCSIPHEIFPSRYNSLSSIRNSSAASDRYHGVQLGATAVSPCPQTPFEVCSHHSDYTKTLHLCCFRSCTNRLSCIYAKLKSLCNVSCWPTLLYYPNRKCGCRCSLPKLLNENIMVLSITQVLFGLLAITLSGLSYLRTVFLHQMATGLWAGVLMLITGSYGLHAARRPILSSLIGLLVLSSLATLSACILIGVSVAGTIEDGFLNENNIRHGNQYDDVSKFSVVVLRNITPTQKLGTKLISRPYLQPTHSVNATLKLGDKNTLPLTKNGFTPSSASSSRTSDVSLHLMLLVVGILEASVSLAMSITCFRCIYSRHANFHSRITRSSRTNIVSFNASTANQAASILRSGALTNFVGTGNVLLALDAGISDHLGFQSSGSISNRSTQKPHIHHTLIPFLPELNRHSLILTQAGSGTMAWTAARAAANLVCTERCDMGDSTMPPPTQLNATQHSNIRRSRLLTYNTSNQRPSSQINASRRPRLLYTSLHTPFTQLTSINNSSRENSFPNPPPFSPHSTLVYVIPSPTHDEPPMIFPPFPPSYNELNKRPASQTPLFCPQNEQALARSRSGCTVRLGTHRSRLPLRPFSRYMSFRSRRSYYNLRWRRLFRLQRNLTSSGPTATQNITNRSSAASAPIPAGDRLIQPVLIIDDHNQKSYTNVSDDPPPKYSKYGNQRSTIS